MTRFLGNGIPLLEHLTNLDGCPTARLAALPTPVSGLHSFRVRAVAPLA